MSTYERRISGLYVPPLSYIDGVSAIRRSTNLGFHAMSRPTCIPIQSCYVPYCFAFPIPAPPSAIAHTQPTISATSRLYRTFFVFTLALSTSVTSPTSLPLPSISAAALRVAPVSLRRAGLFARCSENRCQARNLWMQCAAASNQTRPIHTWPPVVPPIAIETPHRLLIPALQT